MLLSLLRLAMLSWAAAVLVVAPNLAASACWACCSQQMRDSRGADSTTPGRRPCCDRHRAQVRKELPACPACPKCESSRPVQASMPASSVEWRPELAVCDWLMPEAACPAQAARREESIAGAASLASRPSLTVLYCSWLE